MKNIDVVKLHSRAPRQTETLINYVKIGWDTIGGTRSTRPRFITRSTGSRVIDPSRASRNDRLVPGEPRLVGAVARAEMNPYDEAARRDRWEWRTAWRRLGA
jgi:hypothetical protein